MKQLFLGVVLFVGLGLCSGCSEKVKGPEKFVVSGTITSADGTPIPAGEITFEPDGGGGNSGPGSNLQFMGSEYSLPRENGVVGGKYNVYIIPFDGKPHPESPYGLPTVQAPILEKVELPAEDSTKDFKLP